jgi:hypothetical protein
VRDINLVEAFLKNTLQVPHTQIFKLTASKSDDPNQPQEPPEHLPTYENIVAKFKQLTELAQPQDQVYKSLNKINCTKSNPLSVLSSTPLPSRERGRGEVNMLMCK